MQLAIPCATTMPRLSAVALSKLRPVASIGMFAVWLPAAHGRDVQVRQRLVPVLQQFC
jgi:hypothetical protein